MLDKVFVSNEGEDSPACETCETLSYVAKGRPKEKIVVQRTLQNSAEVYEKDASNSIEFNFPTTITFPSGHPAIENLSKSVANAIPIFSVQTNVVNGFLDFSVFCSID